MAKTPINDGEDGLWDLVMRDVTPLKGRKTAPAKPQTPGKSSAPKVARTGNRPVGETLAPTRAPSRDLDRRTEQKLARGQMDIEAVFDLHGHGQAAAREKLIGFLQDSWQRGMRCVLVITGKGKGGEGVLRSRLPEWIDEPPLRSFVLQARQAQRGHGGAGAFYILLRRQRERD